MTQSFRPLLRHAARWTHRDRQRHHPFPIEVPDRTRELRIRFRWGPIEVGSEHERNLVTLSLVGPTGLRGAAVREDPDQAIAIGEESASEGFTPGPIEPGPWTVVVDAAEILNDGTSSGWLELELEVDALVGRESGVARSPAVGSPGSPERARSSDGARAAGARWYRGDLHSHTTHSDGTISVGDRARGAADRGLDFLAITDHNTISHCRAADPWPDALTRIDGCEVTTFHGHLAVLGIRDWIDWREARRGDGAATIVDQAHEQGALVSINHPAAFGNPWCAGCHWDFARVDYSRIDAIEVWNGRWSEPETDNAGALALWTDLLDAGLRPTAISGTDSHSAAEDAYPALPHTAVHAEDASAASILEGIRGGRVILSSGPSITFVARGPDGATRAVPGAEMTGGGPVDLVVDVRELDRPATLWCVSSGRMDELARATGASLHVEDRLTGLAGWWRVELRDGTSSVGDLLALTNPIYLGGSEAVGRSQAGRQ